MNWNGHSIACVLGYAVVSTIARAVAGDESVAGTVLQLAGSAVVGWYCAVVDNQEGAS